MKPRWPTPVAWSALRPPLRRYRVMLRANPIAFRRRLLRKVEGELHNAGLAGWRRFSGRTTI
jgi:hypothetical protein